MTGFLYAFSKISEVQRFFTTWAPFKIAQNKPCLWSEEMQRKDYLPFIERFVAQLALIFIVD